VLILRLGTSYCLCLISLPLQEQLLSYTTFGEDASLPADPLRLVIVRDMSLTGFEAPCVHTLYVDKPI
jgi:hypothetical protein